MEWYQFQRPCVFESCSIDMSKTVQDRAIVIIEH